MNAPRTRTRTRRRARVDRPGFTLVELLVVVLIVVIISVATLKVALLDQGGRQVSEAARMLQAAIVGARDAAFRSNSPRGIRLLPDPNFNGLNGGTLAANRMVSIESAPDYNTGIVSITSALDLTGFLTLHETVGSPIPNEPTSWYWNIRQGDKIRIDDSGRYYTIAGPNLAGAYNLSTGLPYNVERYINNGPQGQVMTANGLVTYDPNPINTPANNGNHYPEFLHVVNGQDDDGDGWVDEGFDGIDNDGDGVIDPAYNGIDDDGMNGVDDPGELTFGNGGEYEPEQFVGNEFNSLNFGGEKNKRYTIVRRPVVSEGAREVMLPQGVVIDLTTWNGPGAVNAAGTFQPILPERSRVPIDPYSHFVDIMVTANGQVLTAGAGQSAGSMAGGMASFPTSNMPFYHFWIAEREDIYDPLFGLAQAKSVVQNNLVLVPGTYVPVANPNSHSLNPPAVNLLPMPQGVAGYIPSGNNGPYLTGERRLVTLFVKTGQVLSYDIGLSDFDPTNINLPYLRAQFGTREAK